MLPLLPRVQPRAGCAAPMLRSHLSCLLNVAENQMGSLKSARTRGLFHAAGLAMELGATGITLRLRALEAAEAAQCL